MKTINRIFFSLLFIGTLFSGCKKASPVGSMPDHFVKRALIEETTAEWCCDCPPGGDMINSLKTAFGDKLVAVSIHDRDFLDMSGIYDPIASALGESIGQFPTATIDRSPGSAGGQYWDYYSNWNSDIQTELSKDNNTGIAMTTSIQGSTASVEVHVGYHTTNNYDMRLNVYLIENNIPQQTQCAGPSGPPDPGYVHQQVLRQVATPALGDPISMSAGSEVVKKYTFNIGGYTPSNLVAVAFVEKWGGTGNDAAVFNSRQVRLGEIATWQ